MCVRSCGPWEYDHGMPQPSARKLKSSPHAHYSIMLRPYKVTLKVLIHGTMSTFSMMRNTPSFRTAKTECYNGEHFWLHIQFRPLDHLSESDLVLLTVANRDDRHHVQSQDRSGDAKTRGQSEDSLSLYTLTYIDVLASIHIYSSLNPRERRSHVFRST